MSNKKDITQKDITPKCMKHKDIPKVRNDTGKVLNTEVSHNKDITQNDLEDKHHRSKHHPKIFHKREKERLRQRQRKRD